MDVKGLGDFYLISVDPRCGARRTQRRFRRLCSSHWGAAGSVSLQNMSIEWFSSENDDADGLSSLSRMLNELRDSGMEDGEALAVCSEAIVMEIGVKLLTLMKKGAPDSAAVSVIGVIVGLLRAGYDAAEDATAAIRVLASRGTHGDTIREAGGIPLLVRVLQDQPSVAGAEHASGALAHLVMQRAANREAVHNCGGVPVLVASLRLESQAAEYAASSLGAIVISGPPAATRAACEMVGELPSAVLQRFPNLELVVASTTRHAAAQPSARQPSALPAIVVPPMVSAGWLPTLLGWLPNLGRMARGRSWAACVLPDEFTCPITHEPFFDPCVASDGHTYERAAIQQVIDHGNGLSPLTRETLSRDLYANFQCRKQVAAWQQVQAAGAVGITTVASSAKGLTCLACAGILAALTLRASVESLCW